MKRSLPLLGLLLTLGISAPLSADPPERVARLNYIQGDVTFRPAGLDDWTDASVNRPVITDDELWTDLDSRAELHLGSAAIRLGSMTAFSFLALDDHLAQIRLSQGTLDVRIRHLGDEDTFEIDAPNLSLSALRPGSYRISVSADGRRTDVTLRSGEMEGTAEGTAFTVHPHETMTIEGYGENQRREVADVPQPDSFDRWCRDRDIRDDRAAEMTHVPREVIGYEDLADYGSWQSSPVYGWVWTPRAVRVGWAPYHDGHWAWIEPWGWTWVDDAPWGFAPFHYGRWAWVSSRWVWVPGAVVRPVYAPALVAFVGGARWSASISFGGRGGVAWFPLAPGEVYVPSYRVRPEYVRAVNAQVVNVTKVNVTNINVTNITYANQRVVGAVTAVSHEDFTRARPVAQAAVAVSVKDAASFQVAGSTAPIAPQAASVLGRPAGTPARIVRAPVAVFSRPVVAKTSPPPPSVPFSAQQPALEQHPGRALEPAEVQRIRPSVSLQPKPAVHPALTGGFVPPKEATQPPKGSPAVPAVSSGSGTPAAVQPAPLIRPAPPSGSVTPREVVHTPRTDTANPAEGFGSRTPPNPDQPKAVIHPATTTSVTTTSVTTTSVAPKEVVQPPKTDSAKPAGVPVSHPPINVVQPPTQTVPPPAPRRERIIQTTTERVAEPPRPVVKDTPPPAEQPKSVEPPKKEVKATDEKKGQPADKKKEEPKKDPGKKDDKKKDDQKKDDPKKDDH